VLGGRQRNEPLERRLRALVGTNLNRCHARVERRYGIGVLRCPRFRRGRIPTPGKDHRCQQRTSRGNQRPTSPSSFVSDPGHEYGGVRRPYS
jgi:hypothetical protein